MSWYVKVNEKGTYETHRYETRLGALREYNGWRKALLEKRIHYVYCVPTPDEVKKLLNVEVSGATDEQKAEYGICGWDVWLRVDRAELIGEPGEGDYYYRFFVHQRDEWYAKLTHSNIPETYLPKQDAANIAILAVHASLEVEPE